MTDDQELIARLRSNIFGMRSTRKLTADRIEALTEQLAAAEDEIEMQEQEACMMENDYIKLEKERDALEAKLAKVVEALEKIAGVKGPYSHPFPEASEGYGAFAIVTSRATLVEIKGESHE
jgi:septal ring factor EnvC (AmiA/AmiB activator)